MKVGLGWVGLGWGGGGGGGGGRGIKMKNNIMAAKQNIFDMMITKES